MRQRHHDGRNHKQLRVAANSQFQEKKRCTTLQNTVVVVVETDSRDTCLVRGVLLLARPPAPLWPRTIIVWAYAGRAIGAPSQDLLLRRQRR